MALTMSNATQGFDNTGVQDLINDLELNVINETITAMNQGIATLYASVDASWQGNSAETFKDNLQTDKDNVVQGLRDAQNTLKSELYDIANSLDEADSNLVKKREG